jgi:hypothetical protein
MSLVSITRYRRGAAAGEGGGAGGLGGLGGGGLGLPAAASNLNSPLPFNETPIVVVLRRSPMSYHPVARRPNTLRPMPERNAYQPVEDHNDPFGATVQLSGVDANPIAQALRSL